MSDKLKFALSLIAMTAIASCGGGNNNNADVVPDPPAGPAGQPTPSPSPGAQPIRWRSIVITESRAAEDGTCGNATFSLSFDRSWREDRCGNIRTGQLRRSDFNPINNHANAMIRGGFPAQPRCDAAGGWNGTYTVDVVLATGSTQRLITVTPEQICHLGSARGAEHLADHVESAWNRLQPPGPPRTCIPEDPHCF